MKTKYTLQKTSIHNFPSGVIQWRYRDVQLSLIYKRIKLANPNLKKHHHNKERQHSKAMNRWYS